MKINWKAVGIWLAKVIGQAAAEKVVGKISEKKDDQ